MCKIKMVLFVEKKKISFGKTNSGVNAVHEVGLQGKGECCFENVSQENYSVVHSE